MLMKIRVSDKGLRFRLSVNEVEQLHTEGVCTTHLQVTDAVRLSFCIRAVHEPDVHLSESSAGNIVVLWPKDEIAAWANDAQREGLYVDVQIAAGNSFNIAIEKDYACNPEDEKKHPDRFFPRPKSSPSC